MDHNGTMDDNGTLAPTRREFLRNVFTATLLSAVVPGVVLGRLTPALRVRNASLVGTYRIDLTLAEYTALRTVNGSIKIQLEGMPEFDMPIVVTRTAQDQFVAVYSQCTHSGCEVEVYKASIDRIECKCHGSRFLADGTVKRGPAPSDLRSFPTRYDGADIVEIEIEGLPAAIADDHSVGSFLGQPSVDVAGATLNVVLSLVHPDQVLLRIHAVSGAEVIREDRGRMPGGLSGATIDVTTLPAGVYLLSLETSSGFRETKKFVISR